MYCLEHVSLPENEILPFVEAPELEVELMRCLHVKARTGKQCGRRAIAGSDFCWGHSGDDVKAELLEARDEARAWVIGRVGKALHVMDLLMEDEDSAVRFRAAKDLLDRAGLAAPSRVEGTIEHVVSETTREMDDEIAKLIARAGAIVAPSTEVEDVRSAEEE